MLPLIRWYLRKKKNEKEEDKDSFQESVEKAIERAAFSSKAERKTSENTLLVGKIEIFPN